MNLVGDSKTFRPLPSLLLWGWGQVFPLIFSLHYLSSLSHQGHSTHPQYPPPLTTTRSPRWKIMCCNLLPNLKISYVLFLYSPPPLLLSVTQQFLDAGRNDGRRGKNASMTPTTGSFSPGQLIACQQTLPTHLRSSSNNLLCRLVRPLL